MDDLIRPGFLCAFDFDGTLAPIVSHPDGARLPPDIRTRLAALSELAPVAVITGRSLDDITRRLDLRVDFMLGNHGIEGLPGWEQQARKFQRMCAGWHEEMSAHLAGAATQAAGIQMENKRYSLSVHYRQAPDPLRAEAMLEQWFASLKPAPRIIAGKYVYNLLPEGAGDKGRAMEQLMLSSGAHGALYAGDDVTDEDVFRLGRSDILSVRVERAAHSAAEFALERWQDMSVMLDELIRRLGAAGGRNWVREPLPAPK